MYGYEETKRWPLVLVVALVLCLPMCGYVGGCIYHSVIFDKECGDYLKRAADANTIELAEENLHFALLYAEEENLTRGYTSVFYRTPDEDIGYWYRNLKVSEDELRKIPADASRLEKSNVLIKLRETIMDEGKQTSVTLPEGITLYPNNAAWALFGTIAMLFCLGGMTYIAHWVVRYT